MKKIVIAITGASGSIYAKRLMEQLSHFEDVEVGVVYSKMRRTYGAMSWERRFTQIIRFMIALTIGHHLLLVLPNMSIW